MRQAHKNIRFTLLFLILLSVGLLYKPIDAKASEDPIWNLIKDMKLYDVSDGSIESMEDYSGEINILVASPVTYIGEVDKLEALLNESTKDKVNVFLLCQSDYSEVKNVYDNGNYKYTMFCVSETDSSYYNSYLWSIFEALGHSGTFYYPGVCMFDANDCLKYESNASVTQSKLASAILSCDSQIKLNSFISDELILQANKKLYDSQRSDKVALEYFLHSSYSIESEDAAIKAKAIEITAGIEGAYDKAKAINTWVAENIYYNYDYYYDESKPIVYNATDVLETGYTVCEGYANLYAALCRAAGIPCRKISGYALGVGSVEWPVGFVDENYSDTNHAWNEFYADGRWVTVDSTWDSGNTYKNGQFYKGIREIRYFDMNLTDFSLKHRIVYTGDNSVPHMATNIKTESGDDIHPYAKITWDKALGAWEYNIYRADSINGTYTLIGSTYWNDYTDKNVEYDREYYYKISSVADNDYETELSAQVRYINERIDINSCNVELDIKSIQGTIGEDGLYHYTYSRALISPSFVIKCSEKTLSNYRDYTYSYENNMDAGKAKIKITGLNKYKNTLEYTYIIDTCKITNDMLSNVTEQSYWGKKLEPKIWVRHNGYSLVADTEYRINYSNNDRPGMATITINGIGNYSETVTKTFTILKNVVKNVVASRDSDTKPYAKIMWDANSYDNVVKYNIYRADSQDGEYSLVGSTERYWTSYIDKTAQYEKEYYYKLSITSNDNYETDLSERVRYYVERTDITPSVIRIDTNDYTGESVVDGIYHYTYTGDEISPYIYLYDNDARLYENYDYSCQYENNINAGEAKIKITGINRYKGNIEYTYVIDKAEIVSQMVDNISKQIYGDKAICPDFDIYFNGNKLTESVDYTCSFKDNDKIGKASVIIEGIGNYYGKLSKQFDIVCNHESTATLKKSATMSSNGTIEYKCKLCGAVLSTKSISRIKSVSLSKTSFTYNAKTQKPTITVKDQSGKTISSKYYTVTYASSSKFVGKYTVKIKFKGNYSGTKTLTYTIVPKATTLKSLTTGSKKFSVKWNKQSSQTTGYQIQYSTKSSFTSAKTITISKTSSLSTTVKSLIAKKKYYVRIRTYKKVKYNGKYIYLYSSWSKSKNISTKK